MLLVLTKKIMQEKSGKLLTPSLSSPYSHTPILYINCLLTTVYPCLFVLQRTKCMPGVTMPWVSVARDTVRALSHTLRKWLAWKVLPYIRSQRERLTVWPGQLSPRTGTSREQRWCICANCTQSGFERMSLINAI